MSVEILGKDKVIARLAELKERLDPAVEAELKEFAEACRDMAKIFVPIDTGSLQKSIRVQNYTREGGTHRIGVSAGGYITNPKSGRKVDYAAHVEFGTSRMRPRPYMRPAYEMVKKGVAEALKERLT
jgi:HK97 gp10 family phage protein